MIAIRSAETTDASAVCELLAQLGYPASVEEIPGRLSAITGLPDAVALVAVDEGVVVGMVTAHVIPAIHETEPVALLTAMVVSEGHRAAGIGSLLVSHIERWAARKGARRISLTSGNHREHAHGFYERRDYVRTGLRFTKKLESDR